MAKFSISQSKVRTYRRCRRQYYYKYVEGLRPKRVRRPLQFGRIVHEMLEADFEGNDPFEKLEEIEASAPKMFREEVEEYGNIIEDVAYIMEEYFEYWDPRSLQPIKKGDRFTEHRFEINLGDGLVFKGVIDCLAKTPNRLKWLTEHKTFDKKPSTDHQWRNLQSAVYMKAVELLGWGRLDGTAWNYIHSKAPSVPSITKAGKLSEAKCKTLPNRLREFLEDHDIPESKATKQLKAAEGYRRDYFFRVFTPVNPQVVDMVFNDFVDTGREMREDTSRIQNIDRHCDWCDYEPLCRAELTGGDVEYIKEAQFGPEKVEDRFKGNEKVHTKTADLTKKVRRRRKHRVKRKAPRKKARS